MLIWMYNKSSSWSRWTGADKQADLFCGKRFESRAVLIEFDSALACWWMAEGCSGNEGRRAVGGSSEEVWIVIDIPIVVAVEVRLGFFVVEMILLASAV